MNRYWNVKVDTKYLNRTKANNRRLFHIKIIDSSDKNIDYLNEDLNASDELLLNDASPSSQQQANTNLIQMQTHGTSQNDDEEDNIDDDEIDEEEDEDDDDDYSSSFKVRATKTTDFMTEQFVGQLKASLPHLDPSLVDCLFNGRTRRVSLFIVGCDTNAYTGLFIINENLYLLKPNQPSASNQYPYRIELLPGRLKYSTGTDNDLLGELIQSSREKRATKTADPIAAKVKQSNETIALNLNLNLDKSYFSANDTNSYMKDILFQINLVNNYYVSEHGIRLKLNKFGLVDFDANMSDRTLILNNDDELKAAYKAKTTMSQLFLNLIKQNSLQQSFEAEASIDSINLFVAKRDRFLTAQHQLSNSQLGKFNETNVYNHLFMNRKLIDFDGLATRSTLSLCGGASKQPKKLPYESIVLVKDNYQRDAVSLFAVNKSAIEQANVIIDLIGFNLGNRHHSRVDDTSSMEHEQQSIQNDNMDCTKPIADFNWYFQLKNNNLNSLRRLKSRSNPDHQAGNNCINRRIQINRNRLHCSNSTDSNRVQAQNENLALMNFRMKSTLLKQINEFKKRNLCGNGVVDLEFGEQCDCGGLSIDLFGANSTINKNILMYNFVKSCNLDCCDMKTCRFKSSDMQCSMGECCNSECKLKKKSTVCRAARQNGESTCDFVEYCDGKTPTCPEDVFYHNGLACSSLKRGNEESGTCWNGNCVSKSGQCRSLWSRESSSSDPICYKNFNTIGFENGNCDTEHYQNGTKTSKAYKKCSEEDAECGILNCQQGSDQPIIKSENYFKSTTIHNGHTFECKQVIAANKINIYVNDGASCSASNEKRVCVNRKCTRLADILQNDESDSGASNKCISPDSKSQRKKKSSNHLALCSSHGICDNKQICHCFDGFTGKFCELKSDFSVNAIGSSGFDFTGFYKNMNTLNIVGFFSFFLIIAFIISLFVCRGKSSKKKRAKSEKNLLKNEHQIKTNFLNEERDFDFSNNDSSLISSSTNQSSAFKKKKKSLFNSKSKSDENSKKSSNNNNNNNNNLSRMTNGSENDFDLSVTKLNKAIQQLNYKPTKSILKKHSDHMQIEGEAESDGENPALKIFMPQGQASIYNTLPLKRPNNQMRRSPNHAEINDSNISASSFKLDQQSNGLFVTNGTNSLNRSAMRARSAKNRPAFDDQIIYDNNVASNGPKRAKPRRSMSSSSSSSLNECLSSPSGSNRNSYESSESLSILSSASKTNQKSKAKSKQSASRPNESVNYEEVKEIQLTSPFKSTKANESDQAKASNTSTFVINNKYNEALNKKINALKSDNKSDSSFNTSITPKPVHQNQHQLVADAKSAKILRLNKFHDIQGGQDMKKNDYLKVQDYLNELNILSKQNNFSLTKRESGSVLETNEAAFDMTESFDAAEIEIIENNFVDNVALETDLEIYPEESQFGLSYKENINKLQTASLFINKLNKSTNNESNLSELSLKNGSSQSPMSLLNKIKSPAQLNHQELKSPAKEASAEPSLLLTPKRPMSLLTQNVNGSKEVTSPHKFMMNLQPLQLNIGNHKYNDQEINSQTNLQTINLHTNNSESSSGYSSVILNKQMGNGIKCDQMMMMHPGSMSSSSTTTMTSSAKQKEAKQHQLNGQATTSSGTGSSSMSSTSSSTSLSLMSSMSQSPHQHQQQQTFVGKRDSKTSSSSTAQSNDSSSFMDKTPIPPTPIKLYSNQIKYDQTPKIQQQQQQQQQQHQQQQDEHLKRISYMLSTKTSSINYTG